MYGLDSAYNEIRKLKPRKRNKGYNKYLGNLLIRKINVLVEPITSVLLKNKLIKSASKPEFLYKTYIEAYKENKEFEKVFLEKKLTKIANKPKFVNDSSILILANKYKISL